MLEVAGIHTYYGPSHVLHGVSLIVQPGEVVTLLGRNGAGKTTTLRSIIGLTPPRTGRIAYQGDNITGKRAFEVARRGIAYVPEGRRIFTDLTVLENLTIAARPAGRWSIERVLAIFPGLAQRRVHKGRNLSGGEQQMLAIGRALMGDPQLLLLDEPSQGLAPLVVRAVFDVIRRLKEEGMTVLLVEQNVELTLDVADRHYILERGEIVYTAGNEAFRANPELRQQFLSV
jgi:branched-chain amino acid transport system ATP-binding protein